MLQVILAHDHVLDERGQLLVELNDVRFLVHKVLNFGPIFIKSVLMRLLLASSKSIDKFHQHLACL